MDNHNFGTISSSIENGDFDAYFVLVGDPPLSFYEALYNFRDKKAEHGQSLL